MVQKVHHARRGLGADRRLSWRGQGATGGQQAEVEQALGVVIGGAQHLAAGQVFEGRRNAALNLHGPSVQRLAVTQTRQGGAVGAQQEDGFNQITRALLDGQGGELRVVDRAFGHHPVYCQAQLLADLCNAEFGHCRVAPALLGQQIVAGQNGRLAPFDGNVHTV